MILFVNAHQIGHSSIVGSTRRQALFVCLGILARLLLDFFPHSGGSKLIEMYY